MRSKATAVVSIGIAAVAAQVLLGLWSEKFILPNTPPSPVLATSLFWIVISVALIAVVAVVGPDHERIWLVGFLFLIVTLLGTFFVGQLALSLP